MVADEVQRLAERSANATRQIEALVKTIQADTNEAVMSMERSTTDVVGGALLAENAGACLDELEQANVDTDSSKKAFFVELSDILRTYVARRLGAQPPSPSATPRDI